MRVAIVSDIHDHIAHLKTVLQKLDDVVCYGHSHGFRVEKKGRTTVVNPGEVFGVLTGESTFAIYDTRTGEVERVDVGSR